MDLVYGSEIGFVDGYAIKPHRTFVVNTNAPLHTSGFDIPTSGGVATFPDNSNYADRIFVWRAIGQKLYIEERSLMFTISDGSLCIDFTRTPIIPGTSITIFEEGILCIVVPTASTIHRFYAKLECKSRDTFSILARIKEDEEFRRFGSYHPLSTNGRPLRASVTHHPKKNTIAYCTAEGQLTVVVMAAYSDHSEQYEEFTFGEQGFLKRFLGSPGSKSNLFSDAIVMRNGRLASGMIKTQRKSTFPGLDSDLVFAVTKDGWLQAWNAETKKQLPTTINLISYCSQEEKIENSEDESFVTPSLTEQDGCETNYTIKGYHVFSDILLVISCDKVVNGNSKHSRFHLVKVSNDKFLHLKVYETYGSNEDQLTDYEVLQVDIPSEEAMNSSDDSDSSDVLPPTCIHFYLTVLYKSLSAKKNYCLQRISFAIDWKTSRTFTQFDWHPVKPFQSSSSNQGSCEREAELDEDESHSRPYNLSADASIDSLVDIVFDTDLHSFDVVFRAFQIVSDNYRGIQSVRFGEWTDLSNLVDHYINSSTDFNRKFQAKTERTIRLRLNAPQETQSIARKNFWWAFLRACEELDFAARGIIGLAALQLSGDLKVMTVVHKDRITILGDNNSDFLNIICEDINSKSRSIHDRFKRIANKTFVDLIEEAGKISDRRIFAMNRERTRMANARNGTIVSDDEAMENGYDFDNDGRFLNFSSVFESSITKLTTLFVESSTFDNSKPFADPHPSVFGGSFAQSIVSANIRVTVERRIHLALTLRALLNSISEKKQRAGTSCFGDLESLKCELREIIRIYRELIEQLDLKIVRNGAKMSIGTWLISDDDGLYMMRKEGGYGMDEYPGVVGSDFNSFVGVTTDAAVRALLSTSEVLVLFRKLVNSKQYKILLTILNAYINETRALKPVINFYKGIAYSGTDHPVKALTAFRSSLDAFTDGNSALRKAVFYFLPKMIIPKQGNDPIDDMGIAEYFLTVIRFLKENKHSEEVITVAMSAIDKLPIDNDSVQHISMNLFNELASRNEWFQALKLILRTTVNTEKRNASIRELLTLMLTQGEWEAIATMKFGVHEQVVEEYLRDAAIRQPPTDFKHFYELLFAFYVARKDYRQAASTMYEYAHHIGSAQPMTPELLLRRRDALAAVLNMQSIIGIVPEEDATVYDDYEDTNLVFPAAHDELQSTIEDIDTESSEDAANGNRGSLLRKENLLNVEQAGRSRFGSEHTTNCSGSSGSYFSSSTDNSTGRKLDELKTKMAQHEVDTVKHNQELRNALERRDIDEDTENIRPPPLQTNGEVNMEQDDDEFEDEELSAGTSLTGRMKLIVVSNKDIRDEWVICASRVGLLLTENYDGIPPTEPKELFQELIDNCHFDAAFDIARQYSLNPQQLYFVLVREAIMIDALKDDLNIEMAATQLGGWVRNNRRHCRVVSTTDDHWAVVRGLLDAAQSEWPGDSRPFRGAVEGFLSYQFNVPFWLHNIYELHDSNDYIRCLLDFENYSTALQVVVDLVDREMMKVKLDGDRTWLPYGAIDELMKASGAFAKSALTKSDEEQIMAIEVTKLRKSADEKLVTYFKKVEAFESAQKASSKIFS